MSEASPSAPSLSCSSSREQQQQQQQQQQQSRQETLRAHALDTECAGEGSGLWPAIQSQQPQKVQSLLLAKADPGERRSGWAAVQLAATLPSTPVLVALLCAHADVNARADKVGWTALHYAAHFGQRANVRALIAHRDIDLNVADWTGKVAAEYAAEVAPARRNQATSAMSEDNVQVAGQLNTSSSSTKIPWTEVVATFIDYLEASVPSTPDARDVLGYAPRLPVYTTTKGVFNTHRFAVERSIQRSTSDTEGFMQLCQSTIVNGARQSPLEPRIWNARIVTQDIQNDVLEYCAPLREVMTLRDWYYIRWYIVGEQALKLSSRGGAKWAEHLNFVGLPMPLIYHVLSQKSNRGNLARAFQAEVNDVHVATAKFLELLPEFGSALCANAEVLDMGSDGGGLGLCGFVARRLGASAVVLSDSRPEALRDLQLNAALTLLCEANSHGNFIDTSHFGSGGVAQICHHRLKAFAELTRKGLAVKRITAKGEEEESILASESSSSELLTTKQQHNESLFSNAKFRVGQLVEVNYKQRGKFYPGKVDAIRLVQEEIVQSSVDDGEPPGEHFVIVVNTPARLEAALSAAKLAGACVVLDFFAEWCDPCTAIKPVVQALAEVRPDVLVVAVDVDECRSISDEQYNVTTMPTFVALDPNGQELARVVGADGEGLTVLVSELPPALSRQADSDGMIVPWRKLVDAQDQDVSSSSQSSSRMRTVPKYDVAYLDGDFEGGVAEDAIQHRHTSRWAAIASIVEAYDNGSDSDTGITEASSDNDPAAIVQSSISAQATAQQAAAKVRRPSRPEVFSVARLDLSSGDMIPQILAARPDEPDQRFSFRFDAIVCADMLYDLLSHAKTVVLSLKRLLLGGQADGRAAAATGQEKGNARPCGKVIFSWEHRAQMATRGHTEAQLLNEAVAAGFQVRWVCPRPVDEMGGDEEEFRQREPELARSLELLRPYTFSDFRLVVLELPLVEHCTPERSKVQQLNRAPLVPTGTWPATAAERRAGDFGIEKGRQDLYDSYNGFSGGRVGAAGPDSHPITDQNVGSFDDLD